MSGVFKNSTLHGLTWSFLERVSQQAIQLALSIVLARLLLPEQFGLIAMLSVFIALAQALLDSGFGSALIQKQNVTRLDESSVFFFNVIIGICASGILGLLAPAIAVFYNQPQLVPLTRVLSLNLIINALGVVQTSLLIKQIDFKTQMKASMTAAVVSSVIGIGFALKGFGVWSLVAQSLSVNITRTALLWVFSPWRPLWGFSAKALAGMMPFGLKLFVSSVINTIFINSYNVVIGKVYSAADLGYYSRAQNMQQLPTLQILSTTVGRVLFPLFSSIQSDGALLKKTLTKSISGISLINFPLMVGLAVTARPLVLFLLTDKWLPCVPYIQVLTIVGLFYPLQVVHLSALQAQGKAGLYLRVEIISKVLIVAVILATFRSGVLAMVFGQAIAAVLAFFISSYYSGRLLNYGIFSQIADYLPALLLSTAMGGFIYSFKFLQITNQTLLLGLQIVGGIGFYSTLLIIFKLPVYQELLQIVKSRFGDSL